MVDLLASPAEHEALDPEYSILKQRLARRMRHDGLTDADLPDMDLVAITKAGCYLTEHVKCYVSSCCLDRDETGTSDNHECCWGKMQSQACRLQQKGNP